MTKSNIMICSLVFNDVAMVEMEMPAEKKMEMFMKGYINARNTDKKIMLNVEGWDWEDYTVEPGEGWENITTIDGAGLRQDGATAGLQRQHC